VYIKAISWRLVVDWWRFGVGGMTVPTRPLHDRLTGIYGGGEKLPGLKPITPWTDQGMKKAPTVAGAFCPGANPLAVPRAGIPGRPVSLSSTRATIPRRFYRPIGTSLDLSVP